MTGPTTSPGPRRDRDHVDSEPRPSASAAPIDVRLLPVAASLQVDLMQELATLINEVYAVAEDGLWIDGAARTTVSEVTELTRAGQVAVASIGGRVVGGVRVQRFDAATGEFGMLAADPAHRGLGIGRELVRFAEQTCRANGLAVMRLEVLVPGDWTHPVKEFLDAWYTRMGYRIVRTGSLDEAYPTLAGLLATPCDFVIYHKDLDR